MSIKPYKLFYSFKLSSNPGSLVGQELSIQDSICDLSGYPDTSFTCGDVEWLCLYHVYEETSDDRCFFFALERLSW